MSEQDDKKLSTIVANKFMLGAHQIGARIAFGEQIRGEENYHFAVALSIADIRELAFMIINATSDNQNNEPQ